MWAATWCCCVQGVEPEDVEPITDREELRALLLANGDMLCKVRRPLHGQQQQQHRTRTLTLLLLGPPCGC